ncbi:MAG: hypothetical protein VX185_10080 [Pseudomonadota bacterium]|nr:hypothetical protein [Pseudomonadota bacterium]
MDNEQKSFMSKMQNIQPAHFAESRVSDKPNLKQDISSYYEDEEEHIDYEEQYVEAPLEFSHHSKHTPALFRKFKKKYQDSTDKTPDMAASTFKAFISGIPQGFKEKHIYYSLLVYLSQFELMLVSDIIFVDDQTEFTSTVMVHLDATEEAQHYLESHDNTLELDIYSVLQLPTTTKLVSTELKLVAYEDAAQHAENHAKPTEKKRSFNFSKSAKLFD